MSYWWVNHSQTFKQEIEGGYIWSPQKNRNGARNETYLNLTRVQPNDIIYSYAESKIIAVGVADSIYIPTVRPPDFGQTGEQWDKDGWAVHIRWHELVVPIRPKDYLSEIKDYLPEKNSPIQKNGDGIQSCYLAGISAELGNLLLNRIKAVNDNYIVDILNDTKVDVCNDQITRQLLDDKVLNQTEREAIVKSRCGQGLFRQRLEQLENECRLTGIVDKRFLIASHIKPWRDSDNNERLDGHNGLLLSPHVDKLFDLGYISFRNEHSVLVADTSVEKVLQRWGIDLKKSCGIFDDEQNRYLEYHQKNIFEQRKGA
jgi:putative restriction endonuclease